ncbi:MAG: DUF4252 domain-containing protein [Ignavibacteria bacterium]|nr:MAG: DUF4252 domain-containing protein [Ignavibacteria bacterium]
MKNKIFMLLILFSMALFAQSENIKNDPGYIDFGNLTSFDDGDMVAEVLLEAHLLKMVSKMTKHQDPELAELLNGLKLIKVNAFEVNDENKNQIYDIMNNVDGELKSKGWERIVKVRDHDERANVYIKTDGEEDIVGLVVTAIGEDNEAAFVNIAGRINLETIGRLSEKFDIPEIDKIGKDTTKKKEEE